MFIFVLSFVFFFQQKTAYDMLISDWSSDFCSSYLSNMLSFDLSLYQIDWKKIQITLISASNVLAYTANAAKARIKGGEFSATVRPGAGFKLSGWLSFNRAKDRKSTRLNSSH